ncbi:MAG TPA: ABC transporter permease [Phycisphaerales bacterium]|nr:ABC transporter permease [Phycisphaerales bacterium]HMP35962.1 ABC transporter permease [Phycisphaerales bacterium]
MSDARAGFWAEAWGRALRRPIAVAALAWIGVVAFFAVTAPFVANGHPLLWRAIAPDGARGPLSSPLLAHLSAVDILLPAGALGGAAWLLLARRTAGSVRLGALCCAALQGGLTLLAMTILRDRPAVERLLHGPDASLLRSLGLWSAVAGACAAPFLFATPLRSWLARIAAAVAVALACALAQGWSGAQRLANFDRYAEAEADGRAAASYTVVPWSPGQARTDSYLLPPMTRLADRVPAQAQTPLGERVHVLGTDGVGRDVLAQLIHGCRLSISIGLVSTGIAVIIGVTLGALMGYFGGWVDLLLSRVVEVFMAIPVLFLLIVAAAVLPRNTYVMMAIIGAVTWTGAARFTRAEFLRLRGQEFVQGAQALGLPLRSILFRHMLPNGITPVLVDASFAIAAAILAEATLSYLGLGPEGEASWGRLLSSANTSIGDFVWWLAIYPGLAIFLTVLAYNLLGESIRDAIDPRLRPTIR